jgi:hypothetical protein
MPLNEANGIIDEETDGFTDLGHKALGTGRPKNREGTRVRYLSPHHQKTRNAETVVAMEMADGHDPERLDPEFHLFKANLAAFAGVEQVDLALVPYRQ